MTRPCRIALVLIVGFALLAHRLLVVWLAEHDWIGPAIAGKPTAALVLVAAELVRLGLWVVAPVWLVYAFASRVARP